LLESVYSSPSHRIGAFIVGTAAGDTLRGTAGEDRLEGGLGNDTYIVDSQTDIVIEAEAQGIDTVVSSKSYYLWSNVENLTLTGTAYIGVGNSLDNVLLGNSGPNVLMGGSGNDTIDGGPGLDLAYGNSGDDTFYVSQQSDRVFENPNEGYDSIIADSGDGYYLPANVEALTLIGTTPFGVGNELDNLITGNASTNVLSGGLGNDTLDGGGGFDILWGEAGSDTFMIRKSTEMDIIADFTPGTDRLDVRDYGFISTAEFLARMMQVGSDISIDLGDGDSLILMGVKITSLGTADFVLV
jgi:Ca2+-binding RTX toxin-like protein